MTKKTVLTRVHPEFNKLIKDSDMTSRDFTKMLSERIWDDRVKKVVVTNKRKSGLAGFRL